MAARTPGWPVGTDDYVLTADSSQTLGVKWAASASGFSDPMTTRGDIIVRASGGTDRLALGTNGQVLTSDGTDAGWATPSGGGGGALVLLEQHTASASATLDFTSCISSTYDDYLVEGLSLVPATNAVNFTMQVSTDGGSTWASTTYNWAYSYRLLRGAASGDVYGGIGSRCHIANANSNGRGPIKASRRACSLLAHRSTNASFTT